MDKKSITVKIDESKELIFETGEIGRQAGGAVLVSCKETLVFASCCVAKTPSEEISFSPFRVDYQEKFSSAGKTLGGFLKREGRPSEREILSSRLIDRSLRPMMPDGFVHETQLLSYVWSYDGENLPDPIAICASSAALILSEVPILSPVAGIRIGLIDDTFIANPTNSEMKDSLLNLILSGSEDGILMIEGHCKFLSEETVLEAINFGHSIVKNICSALKTWQQEIGKPKKLNGIRIIPENVCSQVKQLAEDSIEKALSLTDKQSMYNELDKIELSVLSSLSKDSLPEFSEFNIKKTYKSLTSSIMRNKVLSSAIRLDGRSSTDIRKISINLGLLPRTHGSCLFTRGETQTVAVCTLGGESMGQRYEDLNGDGLHKFYLQYSFPPFSVGEVGRAGAPGRREIGHGKLAEKALQYTLPEDNAFPYTIRLESNITESNGSSSMASVCGCCLAMMEAGVPIKTPISGIAMGLILEDNKSMILSDIMGIEDHLGDMDFKVAGSSDGITAFQMDIKVQGISVEIMKQALEQAKQGRLSILDTMKEEISEPKKDMSQHAPRIETLQVKQNKIALIIGPGGKTIRQIIDQTGVQIDINDSGLVSISANSKESMDKAKEIIEGIVGEPEVGRVYQGRVSSVLPFGAFVEILPGKDGLCHISELSTTRIEDIHQHVKAGDILPVKFLGFNDKGQMKLSHKATLTKD